MKFLENDFLEELFFNEEKVNVQTKVVKMFILQ